MSHCKRSILVDLFLGFLELGLVFVVVAYLFIKTVIKWLILALEFLVKESNNG